MLYKDIKQMENNPGHWNLDIQKIGAYSIVRKEIKEIQNQMKLKRHNEKHESDS